MSAPTVRLTAITASATTIAGKSDNSVSLAFLSSRLLQIGGHQFKNGGAFRRKPEQTPFGNNAELRSKP
jgi:hypothetical protein